MRGFRMHQRLPAARDEAVIDEKVFFDVEARVATLEIARGGGGIAERRQATIRSYSSYVPIKNHNSPSGASTPSAR